jgi:type IV pilus assembly protein PilX
MKKLTRQNHRQRGAALVTSLIILLVLTVLGVSAMSTSSLEELMKDAERYIDSWGGMPPTATDSGTSNGLYTTDIFGAYELTAFDKTNVWANGIATTYGADTGVAISNLGDAATLPMYIIEEEDFVAKDASFKAQTQREGAYYYRVTARGEGASSNAVTILQSTFAHRFK